VDIVFLIVRLVVGLGFAAHGAQKLFGWFGGYGLAGTGGFFEGLGFRPGRFFAAGAGLGEFGGGLLLALGLGGPIGPALMIMVMTVAIIVVHLPKGFFAQDGGYELPLIYAAVALTFAFVGFGAYSLDRALNLALFATTAQTWIVLGIGFVLGLLNLLARRPAPQAPQGATSA
jgi:putative oxidoreductase